MPRVEAVRTVPVPLEQAFAVSQMYGPDRIAWDPFVRAQRLVGGDRPATGVRTITTSRHRLSMTSEYVSYNPPKQVGMKMVDGPWFFKNFAGGWMFAPSDTPGHTRATWRYTFTIRPPILAPIADRIGMWMLQRDIEARITAYANACADPQILALVGEAT